MEKRCANCGKLITEYETRLHEELEVCSDDCGIDLIAEKNQNYSRACRRLEEVRDTLKQIIAIKPERDGYPHAFGSVEGLTRIALIEAGAN